MVLDFTLAGKNYRLDVQGDLAITPATFNSCLMRQPALLAYYAGLYRVADGIARQLENDMDFWMSVQRTMVRSTQPNLKTESAIGDAVKSEPEYRSRLDKLSDAMQIRDTLKDVVVAFRDRTQMLMKIGAKLREGEGIDDDSARELTVSHSEDRAYAIAASKVEVAQRQMDALKSKGKRG